jgi:hypothetical protein
MVGCQSGGLSSLTRRKASCRIPAHEHLTESPYGLAASPTFLLIVG